MYKYLFRIAILGSENVGKKTLAKSKFFDHPSNLDTLDTLRIYGWELSKKTVEIDETKAKLLFHIFSHKHYWWDKTTPVNSEIHVRGKHGAIILYDITNPESLELVPQWIKIVRDNAGDIPIFLVGNKFDLTQQREITKEQVEKIKNEHDITALMEISVKTGENMEKMVSNLAPMILNSIKTLDKYKEDVDEYKKRMIKYINQAEEGKKIPEDYQNLGELVDRLKNAININKTGRKESIVYGNILLIRNCSDLLKNPNILIDKDLLQTSIDQAYKSVNDILRRDRSIYYNTHVIMSMFLGTEQTRQFYDKYNVKAPLSIKPILPKNWFLYALYLIIVIVILILLKVI